MTTTFGLGKCGHGLIGVLKFKESVKVLYVVSQTISPNGILVFRCVLSTCKP